MKYALENLTEAQRLEKQSETEAFDYRRELEDLTLGSGAKVLDAGCGSGIVSRFLAQRFPSAEVVGCDFSAERIRFAQEAGKLDRNLRFQEADLTKLPFESSCLDAIVCRFVLEHLPQEPRDQAMAEFFRCLKPGGSLRLIDLDGFLYNLYPRTGFLNEALNQLEAHSPVDLRVGRKLPKLAVDQGFTEVSWKIDIMQFQGASLKQEAEMTSARLENAMEVLGRVIGSREKALRFKNEYLSVLEKPGTVIFYDKFVVSAKRPPRRLSLVRERA